MSGGVDSSVAALLTKETGDECIGATMKLFHNEDIGVKREKTCCSLDDVEDARNVCYRMGIRYYVFNFSERFKEDVMDRFVDAYEHGATPNPCIDCNRYLKFDKMFQRMRELEYDYIVTGHYARVEYDEEKGRYLLKKAVDDTKDQSYVLYSLTQEQLANTCFPLGDYSKTEIRKIAEEQGFFNAHKHDSQDICFIPDGDYKKFLENNSNLKPKKGNIVNSKGEILGKHTGLYNYTIGQRKGIGLAAPEALYVTKIDAEKNVVYVGYKDKLFSKSLVLENVNWSYPQAEKEFEALVKIRYNMKAVSAIVKIKNDCTEIEFLEEVSAVAKGQACVIYSKKDGHLLGGAFVK